MTTGIDGGGGDASGSLPHMGLIRFRGPDAAAFLQGQVSNDTRRLAGGEPLLAAYSSPQGRVLALFHLLPHSSGILALLPREIVLPTIERLRKFVLRAKVEMQDLSDAWSVLGVLGTAALEERRLPVPGPSAAYVEREGLGIALVDPRAGAVAAGLAGRLPRYWVIGETSLPAEPSAEQAWRLADVRAGLPQIYSATREMFVAQMLNLDLIDGISFKKGCFTGQEIIARTQHLGRIKRRLFRLRLAAGTWAIGQAVRLSDGRSGRLTELAPAGETVEALAVLTLDGAADAGLGVDAAAAGGESAAASGAPVALADAAVDALELPLPYPLTQAA